MKNEIHALGQVGLLAALLLALALGCASAAAFAQDKTAASQPPKVAKTKTPQRELIDINSASRAELKSLPGVGDAEADQIVAGRPWKTKADLVMDKVLPEGVYVAIKDRMVARQTRKSPPKRR